MLRLTSRSTLRFADEALLSITAPDRVVERGSCPLYPLRQHHITRFRNLTCLSLNTIQEAYAEGTTDAEQLTNAHHIAGGAIAASAVPVSARLPLFACLRQLTLTQCERLGAEDLQGVAASCRALAALHVHRRTALQHAHASTGGAAGFIAVNPKHCAATGLLGRPSMAPWGLTGLTFAPLAACASLRELELHDILPPPDLRPPGLPPDAVLSIGSLTQLDTLTLSGAAVSVDLYYCLSRLVGLARLSLVLLPYTWEAGGMRRRPSVAPSLARLTGLRSLALALHSTRPAGSGVGGAVDGAAPLGEQLYGILQTAQQRSLEELHLELVGPERGLGSSAAPRREMAGAFSELAPVSLSCSPERLEVLLRGQMSVRRLAALQLCAEQPGGSGGVGGSVPYMWRQGLGGGRNAVGEAGRYLGEDMVRWCLWRLTTAAQSPQGRLEPGGLGGGLGLGPGGRGSVQELVRLSMKWEEGNGDLAEVARTFARLRLPLPPLPERLALLISVAEENGPIDAGTYRSMAAVQRLDLELRVVFGTRRHSPYTHSLADNPAVQRSPLLAAFQAAAASPSAQCLSWLPFELPNLYGLRLLHTGVDGAAVALLAAGLTQLRTLALGVVNLTAGGGGLKPLGTMTTLTELRFGFVRVEPAATAGAAAAAAMPNPPSRWAGQTGPWVRSWNPLEGPGPVAASAPGSSVVRTGGRLRGRQETVATVQADRDSGGGGGGYGAVVGAGGDEISGDSGGGERMAMPACLAELADCCLAFPPRVEGPPVVVLPPRGVSVEQVLWINRRLEGAGGGVGTGALLSLHGRGLD